VADENSSCVFKGYSLLMVVEGRIILVCEIIKCFITRGILRREL